MIGGSTRRVLAAIIAGGALLRFATLDVQSYWLDEASTVLLVRDDLRGVLHTVAEQEAMPPLYFVLAWAWSHLFGTGEVGLRSLSALLGTLTIPVAFAIGARLASERAGLAAAALVAVNPFLLWYSQEARAYALLTLASALATLFWLDALRDPRGRVLAGWAVAAGAALLTHYFAALLLVPQAAVLLARAPARRRRAVAVAIGAAALVGLALAPLLAEQRDGRVGWIVAVGLPRRTVEIVKHWFIGPTGTPWDILALAALALVGLGLAWSLLYGSETARWLAAIAATTVGLALVLAAGGLDFVLDRYLVSALVPVLAIVAAGLLSLPRGTAAVAALGLLFLVFGVVQVADPELRRTDWRTAARRIAASPRPAAVVTTVQGIRPLLVYLSGARTLPVPAPLATVAAAEEWHAGDPRPATPPPVPGLAPADRWDGPTTTLAIARGAASVPLDDPALAARAFAPPGLVIWVP